MTVYRPDRRQPESWEPARRAFGSFKPPLLERSLALSPMLAIRPARRRRLRPLPRLSPRKQAQDLGVVVRGVDVVRMAGRRHGVEKLGVAVEELPGTGVAFERVEVVPHLARQHDG